MKYITYQNDTISKLSLGTVQFGLSYGIANQGGQPSQDNVNTIIEYVYSKGINCFDTAQAYGNSEEVLGKALLKKENIYVISKLKSELFENNLKKNIDTSLRNLGIERLYALLLHDSTLLYHWDEKHTRALSDLKNNKKIVYFGVSIYTDDDFTLALENDSIEFIQIPFSIFDQRAIHNKWLEKANAKNKLIFIRSIFLQGLFFLDSQNLPQNLLAAQPYLEKFDEYCNRLNMTKSQLALSFVDTLAQNALLLFGCDNLQQAQENIETYNHLQTLDSAVIYQMIDDFKDIDESIYNPTKW